MKTLKESILADIDTTLQTGDEWSKELQKKASKFLKQIGSPSNYKKIGGYKISKFINIGAIGDILNVLGFDATDIQLRIINSWPNGSIPKWVLTVSMGTGAWNKQIYPDDTYITDPKIFITELIKPLTKDIDTFKKFLDNMERFDGQHVNMSDLSK